MKRLILAAALFATAPAFASEPTTKSAHPPGHQMEPAGDESAKAMDHSDHCGLPMGDGVISAVDVAKSRATINHKPIPALGWGEMTMAFAIDKTVDLSAFAAGERVHFLLAPDKKAKTQKIAAMCAAEAEAGAHKACMAAMHKAAMKIAGDADKPCAMEGMDHGAMDHRSMDHGSRKKDDAASADDHSQH